MPGPLPQENRRRRNAPTVPTTKLPASGRPGPVPKPPSWVVLGKAGKAWWSWAWKTPEAAAWGTTAVAVAARRASLEDDLATVAEVESLDLLDVLEEKDQQVRAIVKRLAALCGGRLAIQKVMTELDDRLGLSPKSRAALRWTISDDEPATSATSLAAVVDADRWRKLGA